jgi:hypothetical protein
MGLGGYVPVLQQERDIHTASSNYPRAVQLHLELDRVRRHYAHPHTPTVPHLAPSAPTRSYQPTDRPHIPISTHPSIHISTHYHQFARRTRKPARSQRSIARMEFSSSGNLPSQQCPSTMLDAGLAAHACEENLRAWYGTYTLLMLVGGAGGREG